MRTLSSLRRVPSGGRRLLATASLAAFAIVGASFSGAPSHAATRTALNSTPNRTATTLSRLEADFAPMTAATIAPATTAPAKPAPAKPAPAKPVPAKPAPAKPAPTGTAPAATAPAPAAHATTAPRTATPRPTPSHPATVTPTRPKAAVPTVDKPVVKLAASHTSVPAGSAVTFTAVAHHANGAALTGATAALQQAAKGSWVTVGTAKLAAGGVAKFSVTPSAAHTYRVAVPATTSHGTTLATSAASAAVAVRTTMAIGQQIVNYAATFKGHRYVFSAAGPRYFDCSGLVLYVFKHVAGINLPHKASEQAHYGKHISRKDARPGDLIFVHNGSGYVHHVAIYAGNGTWWEAPHTGSWVRHVKIWSNKIEFRRLVGN